MDKAGKDMILETKQLSNLILKCRYEALFWTIENLILNYIL